MRLVALGRESGCGIFKNNALMPQGAGVDRTLPMYGFLGELAIISVENYQGQHCYQFAYLVSPTHFQTLPRVYYKYYSW